jgi:hypothetical protein
MVAVVGEKEWDREQANDGFQNMKSTSTYLFPRPLGVVLLQVPQLHLIY